MTEFANQRPLRHSPRPIGTVRTLGPRRPTAWALRSRKSFLTDLLIFVLGLAGVYSVGVVGALPGNEILLLPLLPVLLVYRGRRALNRDYLWFLILVAG